MKYIIESLPGDKKLKIREDSKRITDKDIVKDIWISKDYSKSGFEIKKDSTVIDIGAHIGAFTIYAASMAGDGFVYSFEPEPENFKLLNENIRLNGFDNVKTYQLAVGKDSKKLKLFLHPQNNAGHSAFLEDGKSFKGQSISLADIFRNNKIKRCDFLKVDCEGGEYDILFGAPKEILKRIRLIVLEYHEWLYKRKNVNDLIRLLDSLGFDVKRKEMDKSKGMIYARNRNL